MRKILWSIITAVALAVVYLAVFHADWIVVPPMAHAYAPDTCVQGVGPDHVCTGTQPPDPTAPAAVTPVAPINPNPQPIDEPVTMPQGWK